MNPNGVQPGVYTNAFPLLNPFRVLDLDDLIPRVEKHNPGLWCLTPSAYLLGAIRLVEPYFFLSSTALENTPVIGYDPVGRTEK